MNTQALQNKVRTIQAKRNNEEGFTLVELLVVITILGVLAAVVVFSISGITDKSKSSACAADKSAVDTAIESYRAQTNGWPATLTALVPTYVRSLPGTSTATALKTNGAEFTYNSTTGQFATVTACPT